MRSTAPSRSRGFIGDGGNFLRGQCPPPDDDVVPRPPEKVAADVPRRNGGSDWPAGCLMVASPCEEVSVCCN